MVQHEEDTNHCHPDADEQANTHPNQNAANEKEILASVAHRVDPTAATRAT
jgi:hypothetical protein